MKSTSLAATLVLILSACKSHEQLDTSNASVAQYPEGMAAVWKAVMTALGELDLRVDSERHDVLGGRVVAVRATGEKVVIEAKSLSERSTQVAVGLGTVDRNMAAVIQASIARALATSAASGEVPPGNSLEATYESSLWACVQAGEQAFEAMGLEITQRVVQDSHAEIASRKAKATPVLVRMETDLRGSLGKHGQGDGEGDGPAPRTRVRVLFAAGASRSPENDDLVRRLKSEFEKHLR